MKTKMNFAGDNGILMVFSSIKISDIYFFLNTMDFRLSDSRFPGCRINHINRRVRLQIGKPLGVSIYYALFG